MRLYLGKDKVKVVLDGNLYKIFLSSVSPTPMESIYLQSVDNYILTDINGVYLLPKESD